MKRTHLLVTMAIMVMVVTNAFAQGPNDSGTYYADANGKKGAELKTALCGIIRANLESNVVSYTPGLWDAYPTTDKRANGKVWDMYSNISNFTFGDDQDKGSAGPEGKYYNREHSFPREWFGGANAPMNTDLFHVYPTDKVVNANRASLPYGETNGSNKDSENHFSKVGACTLTGYSGTVFEPNDDYKGDFARTYFYMVTCYENSLPSWTKGQEHTLDGNKYPGLQAWQLEMLMKWAKNDPVDKPEVKETPRNIAVYGIQKNRNPFIDYPGLEEYIWGTMKEVAFSYDNYQNPTEIVTITAAPKYENNVMYNMAGQVVDKSYKGLVIMNGRKFFNK